MKKILSLISFIATICLSVQAHENDPLVALREETKLFKQSHPNLLSYSCEEIAQLANQWEEEVAHRLMVTKSLRKINPITIQEMLDLLGESQPKVFMRHGEQAKSQRVLALTPSLQKIEMMRASDNRSNPITLESAVELFGSLIVWDYLHQKTGSSFCFQTSENKRAENAAALIAQMIQCKERTVPLWNCVDYPDEAKMKAEEIIGLLPDGTLPWEPSKVDRIIGQGTYERINREMQQQLSLQLDDKNALFVVTHTQQLNALAFHTGLPITRLGNYGFLVVTDLQVRLFPQGLYE